MEIHLLPVAGIWLSNVMIITLLFIIVYKEIISYSKKKALALWQVLFCVRIGHNYFAKQSAL